MSLHITDKKLQKHIKSIGYKGCKNSKEKCGFVKGKTHMFEMKYTEPQGSEGVE